MRIEVDQDRCFGSGLCVLTDSNVFDQDENDGRVQLLRSDVDDGGTAHEAAGLCPSQAITVRDAS